MIAVFSPSVENMEVLLSKFKISNSFKLNTLNVFEAYLNGVKIIMAETAPDKTDIGMIQGIIKYKYPINYAIIQGDCGCLDPKYSQIGDIAISYDSIQFDINFSPIGYPVSVIPIVDDGIFKSSSFLAQVATKASCFCKYNSAIGRFLSGSIFVANTQEANCLKTTYNAKFIDVETGAGLEVSYRNCTPTVSVKGVCDYADNNAVNDFNKYYKEADKRSCEVIYKMLTMLTCNEIK